MAPVCLPLVEQASRDFLINIHSTLTSLETAHIPLDEMVVVDWIIHHAHIIEIAGESYQKNNS